MATPVELDPDYLKEIERARKDLRDLMYTKRCAPLMLRLSFHDAGTYNSKTKTGGPNGSIRFPTEYNYHANKGLEIAVKFCEQVKDKNPLLTYADLYQLAGVVAVEITGGPSIDFVPGRQDSNGPDEEGLLPDPAQGASHLREVFHRMGLSDQDIVVLSRAHTLGRAHPDISGYDGPWTRDPSTFDNSYFVELLNGPTPGLLQLPTDRALVEDLLFQNYVQLYAGDPEAFFEDFAVSYKKLSELGFSPPPNSCSNRLRHKTQLY